MKRAKAVLLFVLCSMLVRSAPSFAETCDPRGLVIAGSQAFYDYIANGDPSSASCWSAERAGFVSNPSTCGPFSPPHDAFQFSDGGVIDQEFTVSPDFTSRNFALTFMLDFTDPTRNRLNSLVAQVVDLTDGALLGSFRHDGFVGDVLCQRVDMNIAGDLAHHPIQVRFTGQKRDLRVSIGVFGIAFFQGPL